MYEISLCLKGEDVIDDILTGSKAFVWVNSWGVFLSRQRTTAKGKQHDDVAASEALTSTATSPSVGPIALSTRACFLMMIGRQQDVVDSAGTVDAFSSSSMAGTRDCCSGITSRSIAAAAASCWSSALSSSFSSSLSLPIVTGSSSSTWITFSMPRDEKGRLIFLSKETGNVVRREMRRKVVSLTRSISWCPMTIKLI